ncbi:uncharacterized protein TrAtP1_005497 [Trichoderma atroviride]|uniref:uncharacterized protein n=1 Tax=Hypocrea atroviridis TaxID=63577 RepID=UPI00332529A9|nr:hypothetical protein TrAtP1_005497 [Trichoderma atroviride]
MSIMAPPEAATTIRYRPLDRSGNEVRLLELQPPTTNDISERVVCRLVHEKLSDASNFIGLSALYGDITATETILLNGASITIPSHLAQALQYMRVVFLAASLPTPDASTTDLPGPASMPPPPLPTPPKKAPGWLRSLLKGVRQMLAEPGVPKGSPPLRIWLDLLCINPRDAREEAERRAHMARAYHHAKMVVGWLGEKDATSDLAVEIIKAWDKVMPRTFGEPGDREAHPENYAPLYEVDGPRGAPKRHPRGHQRPSRRAGLRGHLWIPQPTLLSQLLDPRRHVQGALPGLFAGRRHCVLDANPAPQPRQRGDSRQWRRNVPRRTAPAAGISAAGQRLRLLEGL